MVRESNPVFRRVWFTVRCSRQCCSPPMYYIKLLMNATTDPVYNNDHYWSTCFRDASLSFKNTQVNNTLARLSHPVGLMLQQCVKYITNTFSGQPVAKDKIIWNLGIGNKNRTCVRSFADFRLTTRPYRYFCLSATVAFCWLRIRESNPANHWLTVKPMHLARVLRNKIGHDFCHFNSG